MVTPNHDRPTSACAGDGQLQIDLRSTTVDARRARLVGALQTPGSGRQLEITSDRAEDVHWLEYEAEARLHRSWSWSSVPGSGGSARTIVRAV